MDSTKRKHVISFSAITASGLRSEDQLRLVSSCENSAWQRPATQQRLEDQQSLVDRQRSAAWQGQRNQVDLVTRYGPEGGHGLRSQVDLVTRYGPGGGHSLQNQVDLVTRYGPDGRQNMQNQQRLAGQYGPEIQKIQRAQQSLLKEKSKGQHSLFKSQPKLEAGQSLLKSKQKPKVQQSLLKSNQRPGVQEKSKVKQILSKFSNTELLAITKKPKDFGVKVIGTVDFPTLRFCFDNKGIAHVLPDYDKVVFQRQLLSTEPDVKFCFQTAEKFPFLHNQHADQLFLLNWIEVETLRLWSINLLNNINNARSCVDEAKNLIFLDTEVCSLLKGLEIICQQIQLRTFNKHLDVIEDQVNLLESLKQFLVAIKTNKDGSCFYNALTQTVLNSQELSPIFRLLSIKYLIQEETYFERLCASDIFQERSVDELISHTSDLIEYATLPNIISFCLGFEREIIVVTDTNRETDSVTCYKPKNVSNEVPFFMHLDMRIPHYSCLVHKTKNFDQIIRFKQKNKNVVLIEQILERMETENLNMDCEGLSLNAHEPIEKLESLNQCKTFKKGIKNKAVELKKTDSQKKIKLDDEVQNIKLLIEKTSKQQLQELILIFRENFEKNLAQDDNKKSKAMLNYIGSRKITPNKICVCCNGLFFPKSVRKFDFDTCFAKFIKNNKNDDIKMTKEEFSKSIIAQKTTEYICPTCKINLFEGKIPQMAPCNGFSLPLVNDSVKNLSPLEERFLSPYIPFLQFVELNKWSRYPQLAVRGTVVNIPIDLEEMMTSLPRNFNQVKTAHIKLKRKMEYNACYMNEVVDVERIKQSFDFLKNSTLWKENKISENNSFFDRYEGRKTVPVSELENDLIEINGREFTTEIDEELDDELKAIDLMVVDRDSELADRGQAKIIAPGQGKVPISRKSIKNFDELCYPSIFGGEPFKADASKSTMYKYLLRHNDQRATKPNFVFHMAKTKMEDRVYSVLQIAFRKISDNRILKASDALNNDTVTRLIRDDKAYNWLQSIFGSPSYWAQRKKEIFAMIRQLGLPTFFFTFSVAETYCPELLKYLYELDHGENSITYEDALRLDDSVKNELVRNNPVACERYWDHKMSNLMIFIKSANGTFKEHPVVDYVFREEYQARGSPHRHGLLWLKDAPKFFVGCSEKEKEEIANFADLYISTKSCEEVPYVVFQKHKHGSCCHKGKANKDKCRFNYPKVMMDKTLVLEPLGEDNIEDGGKLRENLKIIKTEMVRISKANENISFEGMLKKLEISRELYIKSIRYGLKKATIFHQRGSQDLLTNNYNIDLLSLVEANMDLQFILHPYGAAKYMVEYVTKSVGGFAKLIEQAAAQAKEGNERIADIYKKVASTFINNYQMCSQEAAAFLQSHCQCVKSRQVVFINTGPKDQRDRVLKSSEELKALDKDSEDIFRENDLDRYTKRQPEMEDICLADYIAKFYKTKKQGYEGQMFERSREKIIRWKKYKLSDDALNFYRVELMLFYPWRDEMLDLINIDHAKVYEKKKEEILKNKEKYVYNASIEEALDEAYGEVENISDNQEDIFDASDDPADPLFLKDWNTKDKDNEKGSRFSYPKSELISFNEIKDMILRLNDKQREFVMHCLTCVKNQILVDSGVKNQQNQIIYITPKVILQGAAGTGKSFVINILNHLLTYVINQRKGKSNDALKILLSAFAGSAAFSIGGVTLNSGLNIPVNRSKGKNGLPELSASNLNSIATELHDVEVNIIDEYSMLGNNMLSAVQSRWKQIKGCQAPFGGLLVILVGDINQLEPVGDSALYKPPSASVPFNPLWEIFQFYELNEVMRQDKREFVYALNNLARGKLTTEDERLIRTREIKNETDVPGQVVRLYFTNKDVERYNRLALENSTETEYKVIAEDNVSNELDSTTKTRILEKFKRKGPSDTSGLHISISFKIGLKYMVTSNVDTKDGIVNGMYGTLEKFTFIKDRLEVVWLKCASEKVGQDARNKIRGKLNLANVNEYKRLVPIVRISKTFYQGNDTENSSTAVTRKQFPLVCAEAVTIHKSQGQTYRQGVCIDLRKLDGYVHNKTTLLYVALSRVTDLKDVYILGKFNKSQFTDSGLMKKEAELNRLKTEKKLKLAFENFDEKKGFVVMYQNARSLRQNYEHINADKWYQNGDVLIFSETNTSLSDDIKLNNFQLEYRSDGLERKTGRGLHFYLKENVNGKLISKVTQNSDKGHVDLIIYEVFDTIIITGYSSPQTKYSELKEILENYLIKFIKERTLLIGDFNVDNCKPNNLRSLLNSHGYHSALDQTIITTDYASQLDIIYINFKPIRFGVYESYFSDHKPVYIEFKH